MDVRQVLESVGIDKLPEQWSERYLRGVENMSKPIYGVVKEEDVYMSLRDGTRLCVDLYRPDAPEQEQFPGLVAYSSYGKSIQTMPRVPLQFKTVLFDHTIEAGDVEYYVKRGYIVAIPDPRGIGKSEGAWDGLYGKVEQEDCYDVIEWLASLPRCSGNIGMIGISYFSILQPLVAALRPPHLKAIMMCEVVDSLYHHNYPGGVMTDRSFMYTDFCPATRAISTSERLYTGEELRRRVQARLADRDTAARPLMTRVLSCWPPKHQSYFFDVLLHDNDGDFWAERSILNRVQEIDIPMYLSSEFYDLGRFIQGPFYVYENARPGLPMKLAGLEKHDDLHLPHRALSEEYVRWYDYWLKGIDTGIMDEPPIKLKVRGIDKYKYEYEWPIARTCWTKYYLRADGSLSTQAEEAPGVAPVEMQHLNPLRHSYWPREAAAATFTSAPMEQDTEVTGPVLLHLEAAIDADDANFVAVLQDVPPQGRPEVLAIGCLRASHREVAQDPDRPWKVTHDHTKRVPVTPGQRMCYNIEIVNICNLFRKGHRIQLQLKNTDPTEYHWMMQLPNAIDIRYSFEVGSEHPSYLLLPVIPHTPEENWL
ncbi:MAG: CocE/NonD family hydrolase [Clostridiales bacterium]|nr:CocE/NonD family hydrolase [Clostridiales bacterium]